MFPLHGCFLYLIICSRLTTARMMASLHMTCPVINKGIPSETPTAPIPIVAQSEVFSLMRARVCVMWFPFPVKKPLSLFATSYPISVFILLSVSKARDIRLKCARATDQMKVWADMGIDAVHC